jgi:DNA-binding MarR family transcriptional regulator
MNSLSGFLGCDPSNVTGIVDHLVELKFIERKECATDRRSKLISLTPKGFALRREILQTTIEKRLDNLDTMTDQEISEFIRLLNKATKSANLPTKKLAA